MILLIPDVDCKYTGTSWVTLRFLAFETPVLFYSQSGLKKKEIKTYHTIVYCEIIMSRSDLPV